jgi:hypothetical protein
VTIFATHGFPLSSSFTPAQLNDRVVHLHANAALMQTIIALPFIASRPALVMLYQIGGDEIDPLRIADQGFEPLEPQQRCGLNLTFL